MLCADVMTRDPVVARVDDDVSVVNKLMKKRGVAFLPVCDLDGRVVGFVTEQHITRVVVAENVGPATPVENVMGRDVCICSPDDDISVAERAIGTHPGRCAVCVDASGKAVGVVGVTDLAKHKPQVH